MGFPGHASPWTMLCQAQLYLFLSTNFLRRRKASTVQYYDNRGQFNHSFVDNRLLLCVLVRMQGKLCCVVDKSSNPYIRMREDSQA